MRIDVYPHASIEENLKELKHQGKTKQDLEKAVEILQGCIDKYDE